MKFLSWMHRWVGAAVAILFGLVMLSGIILTLDHTAQQYGAEVQKYPYESYTAAEIATHVDYIAEQHVGQELLLVEAPTATWPAYFTRVNQGRRGGPPMYYVANESSESGIAYLGSLEEETSNWTRILGAVRALHYRLIWGSLALVAYIGILGMLLALVGLIVWWPFRKGFRWRDSLWPRDVHYSKLLLNHMTGGLVAIGFLMLLSVTGVYLGIRGDFMNMVRHFDGEQQTAAENYVPQSAASDDAMRPWSDLVLTAIAAVPEDYELRVITGMMAEQGNHVVEFQFHAPGDLHPDGWTRVYMNPYKGEVLHTWLSEQKTALRHFAESSRPLHSGENMGLPYIVAIVFGSLIVTVTVFTGFVSFVKRQFWNKRKSGAQLPQANSGAPVAVP